MSSKFNPREMLKRTFSGGSSKNNDDDHHRSPLRSPNGPISPSGNPSSSSPFIQDEAMRRVPSLRAVPDTTPISTSNPIGMLRNARGPVTADQGTAPPRTNRLLDLMNRRNGTPAAQSTLTGGIFPQMPAGLPGARPTIPGQTQSASVMGGKKVSGLAARRGLIAKMKLSDATGDLPIGTPGSSPASSSIGSRPANTMDEFRDIINPEEGWLTFNGAATITRDGVKFANGSAYKMSLDEIESLGELGKGNYGTVYKVRHARTSKPRMGLGLSGQMTMVGHSAIDPAAQTGPGGVKGTSAVAKAIEKNRARTLEKSLGEQRGPDGKKLTGMVMAMKEIRMELDKAKFKTIAKELLILHQCVSPYIIDFYGAFMQDGFVYMCIEYMDGGSVDKLYELGIPEDVLQHITLATVLGLNELKEKHNIIHRDVKPTNILVNTRGQVKICDFGVSGDLVASKARTNIGCQSYMPPERINSGGLSGLSGDEAAYGVQSDIWSLGLSIIECALGKYPYDVTDSILVQLNAIVQGEVPTLPQEGYSPAAHDFVARCLAKAPGQRPAYMGLLQHPWLSSIQKPTTIQEEDEGAEVAVIAKGVENVEIVEGKAAGEVTQGRLGTGKLHVQQPDDVLVAAWVKREMARKEKEKAEGKEDKEKNEETMLR